MELLGKVLVLGWTCPTGVQDQFCWGLIDLAANLVPWIFPPWNLTVTTPPKEGILQAASRFDVTVKRTVATSPLMVIPSTRRILRPAAKRSLCHSSMDALPRYSPISHSSVASESKQSMHCSNSPRSKAFR